MNNVAPIYSELLKDAVSVFTHSAARGLLLLHYSYGKKLRFC